MVASLELCADMNAQSALTLCQAEGCGSRDGSSTPQWAFACPRRCGGTKTITFFCRTGSPVLRPQPPCGRQGLLSLSTHRGMLVSDLRCRELGHARLTPP